MQLRKKSLPYLTLGWNLKKDVTDPRIWHDLLWFNDSLYLSTLFNDAVHILFINNETNVTLNKKSHNELLSHWHFLVVVFVVNLSLLAFVSSIIK